MGDDLPDMENRDPNDLNSHVKVRMLFGSLS